MSLLDIAAVFLILCLASGLTLLLVGLTPVVLTVRAVTGRRV